MDLRASVAARPAAVAAARALAILRFVDFEGPAVEVGAGQGLHGDRKSTRLNSSHDQISYAVFCLKKKMQGSRGADVEASAKSAGDAPVGIPPHRTRPPRSTARGDVQILRSGRAQQEGASSPGHIR